MVKQNMKGAVWRNMDRSLIAFII